jgi:hypothetical protein
MTNDLLSLAAETSGNVRGGEDEIWREVPDGFDEFVTGA